MTDCVVRALVSTFVFLLVTGCELRADECSNDKALLARLDQQLQQDQTALNNWCTNPNSTECQQQGPGMRSAIATLREEIANEMGQIRIDCAPPPPPPIALTVTDVSPDTPYGAANIGPGSGGRIHTLAIDPTNNKVLYAVSTGSGVWKSSDGGLSWNQASTGLKAP